MLAERRRGRRASPGMPGVRGLRQGPEGGQQQLSSRAPAFAYDLRGNGRDVLRAGYGPLLRLRLHQLEHPVRGGQRDRHRRRHGLRGQQRERHPQARTAASSSVGDPITNIQAQNEAGGALPLNSHIASPRIKQPYTDQISLGWSHQLDSADGRRRRLRPHHRDATSAGARAEPARPGVGPAGSRLLARSRTSARRTSRSRSATARASYDGVNFGVRRRMTQRAQFTAWYSLVGRRRHDRQRRRRAEQPEHPEPPGSVRRRAVRTVGPVRRASPRDASAPSWQAPWGIQVVADLGVTARRCRSALIEGVDLNQNGVATTTSRLTAYAFDGVRRHRQAS